MNKYISLFIAAFLLSSNISFADGLGPAISGATPAQFSDNNYWANSHWVQQRGEQGSGLVLTSTSGNVTLANAGGRIAMAADGVNVVYTLPLLSSMPDHVPFGLWNVTSPDAGGTGSIFTVTLQTQGGDSINGPGVPGGSTVIIPPLGSIWLQRETIDMGEGPQTIYLVLGDKGSMGLVGGVAGHHYKSLIDYTDQNVTITANQVGSTIRLTHAGGGGQAILPLLSTVEDQSVIKIVSVNCPADMSSVNNVAVHDPVGDETDRIVYSNNSSATSDNLQCGDWEEFTANVDNGNWSALGGPNSMFYSTFWNTPIFENNPRVLNQSSSGAVVVQPSAFGQYSVTNDPGPFHTISSESIGQFANDATIFNSQGVQLVGHHYGTWNPIGGGGTIDEATAGAVNLIADGGNNYALPLGTNYAAGQAYVFTSAAAGNILVSGGAIRVGTTIIGNVPLGQYDSAEMVANSDGYSLVGGSALFPYSNYFQNQQIASLVVGSASGGNCGAGCINAVDIRIGNGALVPQFQPTIFGAATITASSGHQNIITRGDTGDISNITFNNAVGNIEEGEMQIGPSLFEFRAFGTDGYLFSSLNTNTLSIKQNTQHLFGGVTVGGGTEASVVSGELGYASISATGVAPGAGFCKEEWVAGTVPGTGKKIAYCGTSTTPTTIVDNVGGGL